MIRIKFISYSLFAKSLEGLELGYTEADDKPSDISLVTLNSTDRSLGQKGNRLALNLSVLCCCYCLHVRNIMIMLFLVRYTEHTCMIMLFLQSIRYDPLVKH